MSKTCYAHCWSLDLRHSIADQHVLASLISESVEIARMLHALRRKVEGDS